VLQHPRPRSSHAIAQRKVTADNTDTNVQGLVNLAGANTAMGIIIRSPSRLNNETRNRSGSTILRIVVSPMPSA
jgi:hypothetical protein